jgi:FlaA1/EpsC-like NDP-sugar epimerase
MRVDISKASYELPRRIKRIILLGCDTCTFLLAIYLAFAFRFSTVYPIAIFDYLPIIFLLILIKQVVFIRTGVYHSVLRFTGEEFISTCTKAILISSALFIAICYLFPFRFPRSIVLNDAIITLLLVTTSRLTLRRLFNWLYSINNGNPDIVRAIIYGAGSAGSHLAELLAHDPNRNYEIICFVDDNPHLLNHSVKGYKVYPPKEIPSLMAKNSCNTILLAMPSIRIEDRRRVLERLTSTGATIKTVPNFNDIVTGKLSVNEVRQIDIEELLGRDIVRPDPSLLSQNITGKFVLVTGAGGSIGSELCRQIVQQTPSCLVLYELNEFALYTIAMELSEQYPHIQLISCLGSVTDRDYFMMVLSQYNVETVYHAAAYKHVPIVENNPNRGVLNNVLGTLVAVECAIACQVKNFVLISTDKAVRPTNVMGASKRIAELILQALAEYQSGNTCLAMVRFGNVLGSSGSVVPRFSKQIAKGGPITLTHPDITRYFMSTPEAARLVIQASALAKGGEIFLLDMGEPVKIYDLAVRMILLNRLVPERDIQIQITGLRSGEKLYEELLVDKTNARNTLHPKIFAAYEPRLTWQELEPKLNVLIAAAKTNKDAEMMAILQDLVPEYKCDNPKLFSANLVSSR